MESAQYIIEVHSLVSKGKMNKKEGHDLLKEDASLELEMLKNGEWDKKRKTYVFKEDILKSLVEKRFGKLRA